MNTAFKIILFTAAALIVVKSCVPYLGFENALVGDMAPDVMLTTLEDTEVPLSEVRAEHPAIIFFWATWCPHCRAKMTELAAHRQQIEDQGVKIILVNVGEEAVKVRHFMVSQKLLFQTFLDEDREVSKSYRLIGVPTFFLVDQEGRVMAVENELPANYAQILSGANRL